MREVSVTGFEALVLATKLLQRVRRADPEAGLFEAADLQWWWRRPRRSDDAEKVFWVDEDGPVAGVLITSWTDQDWQCEPVVLPGAGVPDPRIVWQRALDVGAWCAPHGFGIPLGDDDMTFRELASERGLTAGDQDRTAWMSASERPSVTALPSGFSLLDRTQRQRVPHPMGPRNGTGIEERLNQCSLYDPTLDLAVETTDGRVAGYSLYWHDPVTKVGLVEPVRVEEPFQRRGLARAMLTAGIERLVAKGAERIKICFETEAAGALYQGVGFRTTSSTTWYRVEP